MNYIKHLTTFYEMVILDDRLFPSHISLYMALFQLWNANRFENPVSICRKEVLKLCKIGSLNTYHKCLHDLHNFGYIKYEPSHNQFIGSHVHLYNFDTTSDAASIKALQLQSRRNIDTTGVQALRHPRRKIDTTVIQALRHSINSINILNNKIYSEEQSQNENQILEIGKTKNQNPDSIQKVEKERKKVAPKKEKMILSPAIDEVIAFFKSENYPEVEAHKFFNHFESNGWKVGGKTPMKNWNAAARNWILNCQSFASSQNSSQTKALIIPSGKNYSEPL